MKEAAEASAEQRLRGAVEARKWQAAREAAEEYGAWLRTASDGGGARLAAARDLFEWARRAACAAREHARKELRDLERAQAYARRAHAQRTWQVDM